MRNRLRTGVPAGISGMVLATLAGCAVPPGSAATSATSPSPAPAAPIAVLTITTPKPRTPAPTLKTTGAAWPAILTSLAGYGGWLLANPDPALVGNIAAPGCAVSNLIAQQAAGLLAAHA